MQKKWGVLLLVLGVVMAGKVSAKENTMDKKLNTMVKTAVKGCEVELKTYCADVTPGEGRMLACIYAHNDKLSGRCEYALYDAASQLEAMLAGLQHVVGECGDDLQKYCGDVKPGEGRIIDCMKKNKKKLSKKCTQAVNDVK